MIECKYCQTHVQVQTGQPTHLPAGAVASKPTPAAVWIAIGVAVFLTTLGTLGRLAVRTTRGATTVTASGVAPADIAQASLAATPQLLAERFGVAARGTLVSVPVDDPALQTVSFKWEDSHLEHVSLVGITYRNGIPAGVLERARRQLGRELHPAATGGYQFNGEGVNFGYGSSVTINAHRFEDPRWKERLLALWKVLKGSALGTQDTLSAHEKRDVLNIDNPLERLTDVPFDADVDRAEVAVHRVLPGAVRHDDRFRVGLGHPWFGSADLVWENEPGGRLARTNLFYPDGFDFKAQRADVEACLTPLYAEPKTTVRDHLAGDVTLDFAARDGLPRLNVGSQYIGLYFEAASTAGGFAKLVRGLAKCGR